MYLAIGMTEEQYWDKAPKLVVSYRKADEIRYNRENHGKWLQGLYVYEAVLDASPILQAFAKKGTKARPYAEKPYAMTSAQQKKKREDEEKSEMEQAKRYMIGCMSKMNAKLSGEKEVNADGPDY